MAAPKIRIPRYCLHKTTNRAYVRLPTRPRATVKYLGPYGSEESRREYREVVAAWLAEETGGVGGSVSSADPRPHPSPPPAPAALSVAALVGGFLGWARGYYRKRGEATNQATIVDLATRVMVAEFGPTPAADFDARALKRVRDAFVASGLGRKECNRRARIVKQCLGWGVEEGLIPPAGWHSCLAVKGLKKDRTPAPEGEPVGPVPLEVVEATLAKMGRPVAAMVRLQLLTGMRPGEACVVRRCDVDETQSPWLYTPEAHKNEHHGKARRIPLGPKAQALLAGWFAEAGDPSAYLFSPARWAVERARIRRAARRSKVQPSQVDRGRPGGRKRPPKDGYDAGSYRQAVTRAAKAAGQPHWHPNQLRHTYATMVRARYGLDASQVLLGHASADVTQIYAERDFKKAAEIAAEIG